jgi:hypothetical protein
MRRSWRVGLALLAVAVLTACSQKDREPFRDASVSDRNESPARVLTFPDGFSNVAAKCDGPNMVYTAFKGDANRASLSVVAGDPRCRS